MWDRNRSNHYIAAPLAQFLAFQNIQRRCIDHIVLRLVARDALIGSGTRRLGTPWPCSQANTSWNICHVAVCHASTGFCLTQCNMYMYTHPYLYLFMYTYAYLYVCMYMCMYVYVHMYIYICIYTNLYMHMC